MLRLTSSLFLGKSTRSVMLKTRIKNRQVLIQTRIKKKNKGKTFVFGSWPTKKISAYNHHFTYLNVPVLKKKHIVSVDMATTKSIYPNVVLIFALILAFENEPYFTTLSLSVNVTTTWYG